MNTTTTTVQIPAATIVPCDDRCMFSHEDTCECACGGKNHGKGKFLTAEQRRVVRTDAGRRIATVVPGTPEFDAATAALTLRENGLNNREIAAALSIRPATVRRLIRSLLVTEAIVTARTKKVAAAKEITKAREAARVFHTVAA